MTPASPQIEEALLARLLVEPGQIAVLGLESVDFDGQDNRAIWNAMVNLGHAGRAIDIMSIQDEIGRPVQLPVMQLTAAHRAPLDEYATTLKDYSFRRRVIGSLDRVLRHAYEDGDPNSLLASLQDATSEILKGVESGNLMSPDQAVENYLRTLDRRAQGKDGGLAYGLVPLDRVLSPAQAGNMIVLAARPSIGKSALAQGIATHWASIAPYPVLFVSLEMGNNELMDRMLARAGVESGDIDGAREEAENLRGVQIWLLDDPFATTSAIRAAAAKVKMIAGGISGIVVDYLQLVADKGDPEVTRVTRISRNLKAIAREFEVPLLTPSQLSRGVESRSDRHPKLADLRESGAIEQDADVVLGLFRESISEPEADLDILKHRSGVGAGQRIPLYFRLGRASFEELVA